MTAVTHNTIRLPTFLISAGLPPNPTKPKAPVQNKQRPISESDNSAAAFTAGRRAMRRPYIKPGNKKKMQQVNFDSRG